MTYKQPAYKRHGNGATDSMIFLRSDVVKPECSLERNSKTWQVLLNERRVVGCFWGVWKAQFPEESRRNTETMLRWVASGRLRPVVSRVEPLDRWFHVFQALTSRSAIGKCCIRMDDGVITRSAL